MPSPLSTISWQAFAGATSYDVELLDDQGAQLGLVEGHDGLSLPLSTLLPAGQVDGTLAVRVRANVGTYETDWSPATNFNFDDNVPGTVQGVTVS